ELRKASRVVARPIAAHPPQAHDRGGISLLKLRPLVTPANSHATIAHRIVQVGAARAPAQARQAVIRRAVVEVKPFKRLGWPGANKGLQDKVVDEARAPPAERYGEVACRCGAWTQQAPLQPMRPHYVALAVLVPAWPLDHAIQATH